MSEGRQFKLLRRLGAGAHGEVFLAEQESQAGFRRRVALKLLRAELGQHDQAARRMRDEARILGRLSHRHIVGVSDLVRLADRWAVVMDYVPGADLERVLEGLHAAREAFPVRAAVEVAVAVLRALHAAWIVDNGSGVPLRLIHRDIKPSNILLAEDGALKVLDFGVARVDMGTREAETGAVRPGTLRYMAPERLMGEEETPAGDVYATAVSILELLNGEAVGRTPIIDPKHKAFVDAAIDRAKGRAPGHEGLEAVLAALGRAMSAEPADRPSAEDLARELAEHTPNLPGEDLHTFAARFLPRTLELLGDTSEAVTGTLQESASATTATWLGGTDDQAPPVTDGAGRSSGARLGLVGVGIGLAAGLVLLCLVGGVITTLATAWFPVSNPEPVGAPPSEAVVVTTQADVPTTAEETPAGTADAPTAPEEAPSKAPEGQTEAEPSAPPTDSPPATAAPATAPSTRAVAPSRPAVRQPPAEPAPVTPDPDAPRVSAAMFVLPDASSLSVQCGEVSRVGTASVRLSDLPAGLCTVKATYLGKPYSTQIKVTSRREVRCTIQDQELACR